VARSAQAGAKSAQDGLSRFVDGPHAGNYRDVSQHMDEDKRAFWDDFSSAADQRRPAGSSIGTSAMGRGGGRIRTPTSATSSLPPKNAAQDDWGEEW